MQQISLSFDQVVISIGAAVSSANAKINPLIVHLQHNSDEIKLSLEQTRPLQLQATLDPDWYLRVHDVLMTAVAE